MKKQTLYKLSFKIRITLYFHEKFRKVRLKKKTATNKQTNKIKQQKKKHKKNKTKTNKKKVTSLPQFPNDFSHVFYIKNLFSTNHLRS